MKYIYIAKFSNYDNLLKIGCSQEPDRRSYVLSFTHGKVLALKKIPVGESGFDIEDYLHWFFKKQKVNTFGDGHGEFFKFETSFEHAVEIISEVIESFGNEDNYHEEMPDFLSGVIRNLNSVLSPTEKFVLVTILSYLNVSMTHTRPVSYVELCKCSALSRRTLVSTVAKLETAGLIKRHRLGHCSSNYYSVNIDKIKGLCKEN